MEKEYEQPEIELIKFTIEDVIATSDEDEGPVIPDEGDGDDLVDGLSNPAENSLPETAAEATASAEITDENSIV